MWDAYVQIMGNTGCFVLQHLSKTATYSNVPTKNYEYHIFTFHAISELLTEREAKSSLTDSMIEVVICYL